MVVVAAGMRVRLIAVRAATPRRWAVAAMARAAAAGRGPVRAAGAVPSLVLGVSFSFRFRGRREVHVIFRLPLVAVLLPATSSMGLAGKVVSVRVRHPGRARLLLGFGPGHSPAASGVLSRQFHASVIRGGLNSDNRELGLVVELLVRDGRQAGTKFIPEDASEESRVDFSRRGIVDLLPSYPQGLGEGMRVNLLGCMTLLLGRALCHVGGRGFGLGGGWTVSNLMDRRGAGEEGAQDIRDAGQTGCMAADPGPMIPNRGLREGVDVRAVLTEQLEVERMCNFVFTAFGDLRDPLQ